ncbi:MAG: 16S rRNA (cytidine(1402)-2'-O)-methyltransferase [Acidimicrobiales bacterium]
MTNEVEGIDPTAVNDPREAIVSDHSPMPLMVIGTPIGNLGDLSSRALVALQSADVIVAEDTRVTTVLLRAVGLWPKNIVALRGPRAVSGETVAAWVCGGRSVAVVSDAGMPSVSDPGTSLVRAVVDAGGSVSVVPGPSAVATIVAAADFDVSQFRFEGFLPAKAGKRRQVLQRLSFSEVPIVLFEAPHRFADMVVELQSTFGSERRVVVGRELTKKYEEFFHGTIGNLLRWINERTLRGEFVLVVAAADAGSLSRVANLDDPVVSNELIEILQRHRLPTKVSSEILAKATGISKGDAYKRLLRGSEADQIQFGQRDPSDWGR